MSATTDDEHLSELLKQAAQTAGPATAALTDPRQYHLRSRRRRVRRVAVAAATAVAAVVVAALASTLFGVGTATTTPVAPPSRPAMSPAPVSARPGCTGVVTVTVSNGTSVSLGEAVAQLTMRVGDTVTWTADGPCGDQVSGEPQTPGILAHLGRPARFYTAIAPGVVRLGFIHPSCAGDPDPACRGGIAGSGEVTIHVTGS